MDTVVLFSTVRNDISQIFKISSERITPKTQLVEELKFDPEDTHQLTMALEEEFSMEIPSEGLDNLHTVGELVDYLSNVADSHCLPHG